jgi:hypothetical protein
LRGAIDFCLWFETGFNLIISCFKQRRLLLQWIIFA